MNGEADAELLAESRQRLREVRERIARACHDADRSPSEITLIGACKRQPAARIAAVVRAGLSHLGENYVREAQDIQTALLPLLDGEDISSAEAKTPPHWHMIGHLQRNKAALAAGIFQAVDSVDSARLARSLNRRAEETGAVLDICLQVNLSGEKSKSGISEEELPSLLEACLPLTHLRTRGLMTMPAPHPDPEAARSTFARLRGLRDTLSTRPEGGALRDLNMGMSGDLEIAIQEGATMVRVGTDLFGQRPPATSKAESGAENGT